MVGSRAVGNVPPLFISDSDPDGDFDGAAADPGVVSQAWKAWHAEVAFADQFVAEAPDLDVVGKIPDPLRGPASLRWVLVHMVEEYARHNGHADLLRERIDGRVGEYRPALANRLSPLRVPGSTAVWLTDSPENDQGCSSSPEWLHPADPSLGDGGELRLLRQQAHDLAAWFRRARHT